MGKKGDKRERILLGIVDFVFLVVNILGCDKHNRARGARRRMVDTHISHDPSSPSSFWHEVFGSVPKLLLTREQPLNNAPMFKGTFFPPPLRKWDSWVEARPLSDG